MRGAFAIVALVLSAGAAIAASPDAWARHEAEVVKACVKAAGLAKPKATVRPAEFEAHSVALVSGQVATGHMKGHPERMVCLFDKRARTASVASVPEKAGW